MIFVAVRGDTITNGDTSTNSNTSSPSLEVDLADSTGLHARWLPFAGIAAGILVHNVALSALEWLRKSLAAGVVESFGATEGAILAIGAAASLAAFFAARRFRRALNEGHRIAGANRARSFLDTALVVERPGMAHQWLLAYYGLAAIAFLSAIHAVAHVIWHWLSHGLQMSHFAIITASALLALALAAAVRQAERPESHGTKGDPGQNDALILFLSAVADSEVPIFRQLLAATAMPWKKRHVRETLGAHFWAIPARSVSRIWENGNLQQIVVIGSDSSWPQIPALAEGLRQGMGQAPIEIHRWPLEKGIDFRDFDDVKAAVQSAYAFLEDRGLNRITIDVTSGTKICTIVGLMESLPPGRGAIYVTNDLDVHAYNFEHLDGGWFALPHEGP